MTPFSIRIVQDQRAECRIGLTLSIFLLSSNIPSSSIDGALATAISHAAQFDTIHFVGTTDCLAQISSWLSDDSSIRGRLELAVVDFFHSVRIISFNEQTGEHSASCCDGSPAGDALSVISTERTNTLHEIFDTNNGYMRAPQGFHYIKPSKKHVDGFLRTANVLEDHTAASIIAFWLLPNIWNKRIEQIVVDTSGISGVALLACHQAIVRGGMQKLPIISSHRSYGGLDHLRVTQPNETIFLISASTSGGLKSKLVQKGAIPDKVITLFYLGNSEQDTNNIVCNLTKTSANSPSGFDPIENHNADECPYCKQKSYPVSLVGDQFSFEPPRIQEIHITITDLPSPQQRLIDQLAGLDFFKVYRKLGERDLEIYLEVSALFTDRPSNIDYQPTNELLNRTRTRWLSMILRGSPANLRHIVFASYPFSEELSESATGILHRHLTDVSSLMKSSHSLRSGNAEPGGAALVIASCLDDSHELMSINRDLRSIQPQGNTTYVSPVFRASSRKERERIKSNLTYGENGANTFSLYSVIDIDLPEEARDHSWNTELHLLKEIEHWADTAGLNIPQTLTDRIIFLEQAPVNGLSEGLFWPNHQGKPLAIRSDFTLLNTNGGNRCLSQADVFVVVSAVLHNLRHGVRGKSKLAYKPYERSVLSPDNFERFNDGIIQAALLRAAKDYELAYANCDEITSQRMKDMIISYIEKTRNGEGEGLMEFLLAIATRRLTLHMKHLAEIAESVQKHEFQSAAHYHLFAKYISAITAAE